MNKCVLLADDDAAVRQTLGSALNSENYDVILAKTWREAASAFLHRAPDLVLLDLNMPDKDSNIPEKDGWEAFHFMRELNPWLPVIIITGMPSQYTRASRLGASAIMEKPLDLPLLFKAMERIIDETDRERVGCQMGDLYDELPHHMPSCRLLATEPGPTANMDRPPSGMATKPANATQHP